MNERTYTQSELNFWALLAFCAGLLIACAVVAFGFRASEHYTKWKCPECGSKVIMFVGYDDHNHPVIYKEK